MKCDECGGPITTERNVVRRYDIGGLPHVELHGVEVGKCNACGREEVGIPRMAQLHRVIAQAFVTQPRMLAPVELRFLRKHIGLSTENFAKQMGVQRETVSRWENGKIPIGAIADRLVRLLVLTHPPSDCYAVDDLLNSLSNTQAPARLPNVALTNKGTGWSTKQKLHLASR